MILTELIEVVRHDSPLLFLAAPALIGVLLLGAGYINRQYRKRQDAVADEMQRLIRIYVMEGRWDPKDTVISRQAEATLKARVIIR